MNSLTDIILTRPKQTHFSLKLRYPPRQTPVCRRRLPCLMLKYIHLGSKISKVKCVLRNPHFGLETGSDYIGQAKVVEVENLYKKFGDKIILSDINLTLEKGKIYGIVGRNGSGKTVLMKCILGFYSPTSGSVRVFGKKIGKDCDFAPNTGMIIETPGFIGTQTGYNNLKWLLGIKNKNAGQIESIINLVGLDPNLKLCVNKYSLGMRQRLGIAQAIMENPKLLILDEPMNGLDNSGVEDMRKLFLSLKDKGVTILLASHNPLDINILCDEVYEMDKGEMIKT